MKKIEEFKIKINKKKVAVLGIGVSNIPAIAYLSKLGAVITAYDRNIDLEIAVKEKLDEIQVTYYLGEDYLEVMSKQQYDVILRSPGIRPFEPALEIAEKNGSHITSEIELAMALCPCKIIGVTGSDGKTTTTTLIYEFLKHAGYTVHLGGNIGIPILDKIETFSSKDIMVLEMSSFQLMNMRESADIAVITNISPNHLDYHNSFEEYAISKSNIFKNKKQGMCIFNFQDNYTIQYLSLIEKDKLDKKLRYFSVQEPCENGTYLFQDTVYTNLSGCKQALFHKEKVHLLGIHNLANICAAISAVYDFVTIEDIVQTLEQFNGVEHRMEMVRQLNGVKWYNDSIASSPSRTIAGLNSFDKKVILIAGGYDKKIPYAGMGKSLYEKVKYLILVGATSEKIRQSLIDYTISEKIENTVVVVQVECLEQAVKIANEQAISGDIVVMSPASASFDMYKNFEQRGQKFKQLVNNLEKEE